MDRQTDGQSSCLVAAKNAFHWPAWWLVNIGSGNDLVSSGNKPLPEPMLTKFYDTIWQNSAETS